MAAKPCPEVPHLHVFLNTSRDGDSTTSLGSLFQCLTTMSKEIFLNTQSKPPLMRLEAIASRPITSYLGEGATRWHFRDMAVTWVFSSCMSCITRTSSILFFFFFLFFWSNGTIYFYYLFLLPACSGQPLPYWLLSFAILMPRQRPAQCPSLSQW